MRPLLFMTPNALQVGKKAKELQDTRKKKKKEADHAHALALFFII